MSKSLMRSALRLAVQYVIAIVASVLVATVVMILLYCLPIEPMKENVWRSKSIYSFEQGYPQWAGENYKMSQLDNITDGYMLVEAIYPGTEGAVSNAMMNRYIAYEGINPEQAALMQAHGTDAQASVGTYARYWHGYLLFLKPLLLLFDVGDMRIMNMMLCLGLSFLLIIRIRQRLGRKAALAMFLTWCIISPVSVVMSFQFSTTFYVMIVASLLILTHDTWFAKEGRHRYAMLFLFIGIVTNYIDYLTYPLVGMAIPLLLAVLLRERRQDKGLVAFTALNAFSWGVGYACMWIGKWVMATLLTGQNVILEAMNEAAVQSTGQDEIYGTKVDAIHSIYKNIRVIVKWPFILVGIVVAFWALWHLLRRNRTLMLRCTMTDLLIVIIALFPMAWYSVFQGHSISCYWFTYRNLSITVMAGLLLLGRRVSCE